MWGLGGNEVNSDYQIQSRLFLLSNFMTVERCHSKGRLIQTRIILYAMHKQTFLEILDISIICYTIRIYSILILTWLSGCLSGAVLSS
jgi:hypothetical protein